MEVDSTLAECFGQLVKRGLVEEHKFAAGLLDYLLSYLSGKISQQNYEIQKEPINSEDLTSTESEEGEIVYDDLPPVKVEITDEFDMKDTGTDVINKQRNKEINWSKIKKSENKGEVEALCETEDIVDLEEMKEEVMAKTNPVEFAKTKNTVHLHDESTKFYQKLEKLYDEKGNELYGYVSQKNSPVKEELKPLKKKEVLKVRKFANVKGSSKDCEYCSFSLGLNCTFPSFKMRRHKMNKHHVCEFCREKLESPENLDNHKISVHTNSSGDLMCGLGDCKTILSCTNKNALISHVRMFHEKRTYMCGECGKPYRFIKSHRKYCSADPKDIISCTFCDFFTLSSYSFKMHQKREHPSEGRKEWNQRKLSCDSCSFTTSGLSTAEFEAMRLIIHKKIHRDGNIVCDKCEFSTTMRFTFQRHLSVKHNIGERYVCTICDYVTGGVTGKSHLKTHMERHNKDQTYMCDQCEFKTFSQQSLKEHIQRHEGTSRYLCDECEYTSNNYSNFLTHNKAKHGATMSCGDCDFTTKSDRTMRNHKSKHSTTLACGDCDFKTNSLTALRYHKTSKSHGLKEKS